MKIAILAPGRDCHGANFVAAYQVAIFKEMGHQVSFIIGENGNISTDNRGINVEVMRHIPGLTPGHRPWRFILSMLPPPLHLPWLYRALRPLSKFDLIVACDYPTCWFGYYARKLYGVKYIWFVEGLDLPDTTDVFYKRAYFNLGNHWLKSSGSNADLIVTETDALKELLQDRFGISSSVIKGLIDLSRFNQDADGKELRSLYNLGDDPLILYVDRLEPHKEIGILLDSFELVKKSVPNAKLMLIGVCPSKTYMKRIQQRCDDSVIIIDYVPEISQYYAAATVFATCTLWEIAFSHTIMEAQSCGKPVVAFNTGAHKELINNEETGILVEPAGDAAAFASAVISLLSNPSLSRDMGNKAAEFASTMVKEGIKGLQELTNV